MNDDMVLFGERLKETRTKKGLSQKELAEAVGASANTIIACEKALKKPSLDIARKLAACLGVSLDWLCGLTVTTDKPMFSDLIKALTDLSRTFPFCIDDVFTVESVAGQQINEWASPSSKFAISFPLGTIEADDGDFSPQPFYFKNRVNKFLCDWEKMLALANSGTLPKDLYDLWLEKQIRDNEGIQLIVEREARQSLRDEYHC